MKWRFSEVVKDVKSAKEFLKINKIKEYEIIIIWDELTDFETKEKK